MKRKHSWDDELLNESDDDFDWSKFDLSNNNDPCDERVLSFLKRLVLNKKESYIFCYLNGLDFLSPHNDEEYDEESPKVTSLYLLSQKLELSEDQTQFEIENLKTTMWCKFQWDE